MTHEQIKQALDRVLTWRPERQQDAAELLRLMEIQDRESLRLSADQAAEVRERIATPRAASMSLAEVFKRFRE